MFIYPLSTIMEHETLVPSRKISSCLAVLNKERRIQGGSAWTTAGSLRRLMANMFRTVLRISQDWKEKGGEFNHVITKEKSHHMQQAWENRDESVSLLQIKNKQMASLESRLKQGIPPPPAHPIFFFFSPLFFLLSQLYSAEHRTFRNRSLFWWPYEWGHPAEGSLPHKTLVLWGPGTKRAANCEAGTLWYLGLWQIHAIASVSVKI